MALRTIFCPNCGQNTQVNDEKNYSFCIFCGKKIILRQTTVQQSFINQGQQSSETAEPENTVKKQPEQPVANSEIESKLEEVDFYYKLSMEKNEQQNIDSEPVYYLKAQDLLVDLSEKYPKDYRVWWELSKPLDFNCALSGADLYNQYCINENYFNKALDLAIIDVKRKLIEQHDKYKQDKASIQIELQKKQEAVEKQKREEQAAEEEKRLREAEAQAEAAEQERLEQIAKTEEDKKSVEEKRQQNIANSATIWMALSSKDYSMIDATYFTMADANNILIIGAFRVVSNLLYFMSFRIDGNKNNTLYRDQTLVIKIDNKGVIRKYDSKSLKIKGAMPPNDELIIMSDGMGGLMANNMKLTQDVDYVNRIMKDSKKPLLSFSKSFS